MNKYIMCILSFSLLFQIEDIQLEDISQNVPVRRKSKSSKSTTSKYKVKTEPLGEQSIDTRDRKGTASPEESRVKCDSGLIVLNKAKSALSEVISFPCQNCIFFL